MRNDINVYQCNNGHDTVTIDRDEGTTPFITTCPVCKERSQSRLYRVDQGMIPTHEWYRPTGAEIDDICIDKPWEQQRMIRHHVSRGGLLLREIHGQEKRKPTPDANSGRDKERVS